MSLFKKFAAPADMEAARDTLGGAPTFASDIYRGTVKMAYLDKWGSGAMYVALTLNLDGKDYQENITITNKAGECFYVKNDKKYPLPGYSTIDDLCQVTVGAPLSEMDAHTEEKQVKVYDSEARAEVPKIKQVLVGLLGKEVAVAIQQSTETKMDKDADGKYTVPTAETRTSNSIEKVFEPESMLTVVEATNGLTAGEFHKAWSEKNKGVTRDKTVKGAPGAPAGAAPGKVAPQAGAAAPAGRKPLFGNKG